MGIAIYMLQESLVARGFHVVHVPRDSGRIRMDYEDWCLKHLQGEFAVRIHNSGHRLAGYFQLESDALLFTLRWS
jgi:hypothetical protein